MNYNIKINLLKLKGAEVRQLTTWNGNMMDYICIPIQNYYGTVQNASVGEDGEKKAFKGVYLNLEAIEMREKERGSHILLPALSRERMASLTEEQLRKRPILGNLVPWGHKSRKNEGEE
jgi:hypothetical protein